MSQHNKKHLQFLDKGGQINPNIDGINILQY